jgi:adenylate kinase
VKLILVGPPGSGKGTQASAVSAELSIPAISTGEIFRAHVRAGTELGRVAKKYLDSGDLVPDDVTLRMVAERLTEPDALGGWLLDGFPRSIPQAEGLDRHLAEQDTHLDVALELVVDEDEVVRRLSGRRTCRQCQRLYHIDFNPPKEAGVCDNCGGELFQRDDDRQTTIRHRMVVYYQSTAPLLGYYSRESRLVGVDAMGPVEDVSQRIVRAIRRFVE